MDVPTPEHPGEPIILDGSNIAHRAGVRAGGLDVLIQLEETLSAAGWEVLVVVDASLRHRVGDPKTLDGCIEAGWIQVPKGHDADDVVLEEAHRLDAWVLSADRFQDHPKPPRRRLDPALILA